MKIFSETNKNSNVTLKARKILCALCAVVGIFCFLAGTSTAVSASAEGKAEIVMELTTGTVLYEKNAEAQLPMASTTKIMTALLIVEECDLDEEITVADQAVGVEGSSIYLKYGEVITVRDLVYGLMLRSGNDSATALAIHHSGSVNDFVKNMNRRADEMGLTHTHFTNPSGLPDDTHYTTAHDLCVIACNAMQNAVFKEIVGTKNYCGKYRNFVNKNKMLNLLDGANGVKTGYTQKAGRCLVTSAERAGMDVVCVVLNCPDMYERSGDLIDESFNRYCLKEINENQIFMSDKVPCKLEYTSKILVNKNAEIQYKIKNIDHKGKIRKGDWVAELEIYSENNLIFCGNLYSIINE